MAQKSLVFTLMEYPPLSNSAVNGYGIAPSIISAAFEKSKIEVRYKFYPPARAFSLAKSGKVNGTVGWVRSEERAQWFLFSDAYFEAPLVFFHLASIPFDWQDYDDLKGLRIGVTLKNYYGSKFHKAMDDGLLIVDETPTDVIQFDKLLYGRTDLFPLSYYVGYGFIRSRYDEDTANRFTHHPKPLKISKYRILFPKGLKGSAELAAKFNRGLSELKNEAAYDEIIQKNIASFPKTRH